MKEDRYYPKVVGLAWEIITMHERIEELEKEVARLQGVDQKYRELLDSSIAHGQKMMVGIMDIAMTPGVLDAISAHNQRCTWPNCECQNGRAECGKKLEAERD